MVLSIAQSDISGKTVLHNLEVLPWNGVLAHTLPGDALFRQLRALGVPDIDATIGKQDLLLHYSKFLKAKEAAADAELRRLREPGDAA